MARPNKHTVEFFSHDTNAASKKTLYILQYKFGNDGYAFWFKMLELLGSSEGHWFSCRKPDEWAFFVAKMGVTEDICTEIISSLVMLGAIDETLWKESRVLWCQNFIDRLKPFYDKRVQQLPSKPSFRDENPTTDNISGSGNSPDQSGNRQRDIESKEKERGSAGGVSYETSPFLPLAKRILENAEKNNPAITQKADYQKKVVPQKLATITNELRLLVETDLKFMKREEAVKHVGKVLDWALNHSFWSKQVESGDALRRGFAGKTKLITQFNDAQNHKVPRDNRGPAAPSKSGEKTFGGDGV